MPIYGTSRPEEERHESSPAHIPPPALVWTVADGAAGYPERPLRYVIPSAAGGGPDVAARVVMQQLGRQLGQRVNIDNRPGASGVIGTELLARARPTATRSATGTS